MRHYIECLRSLLGVLLVAAKADVLITADSDLLALRDRYAIRTPADLVRKL